MPRMPRSIALVAFAVFALGPAFAQDPAPPTPVPTEAVPTVTGPGALSAPAAPKPPRLDTLRQGLDKTVWDAERRGGPLIAVNPDNVRPWQPKPAPGVPCRFSPRQTWVFAA